jgi:hypothetical protein
MWQGMADAHGGGAKGGKAAPHAQEPGAGAH